MERGSSVSIPPPKIKIHLHLIHTDDGDSAPYSIATLPTGLVLSGYFENDLVINSSLTLNLQNSEDYYGGWYIKLGVRRQKDQAGSFFIQGRISLRPRLPPPFVPFAFCIGLN